MTVTKKKLRFAPKGTGDVDPDIQHLFDAVTNAKDREALTHLEYKLYAYESFARDIAITVWDYKNPESQSITTNSDFVGESLMSFYLLEHKVNGVPHRSHTFDEDGLEDISLDAVEKRVDDDMKDKK